MYYPHTSYRTAYRTARGQVTIISRPFRFQNWSTGDLGNSDLERQGDLLLRGQAMSRVGKIIQPYWFTAIAANTA